MSKGLKIVHYVNQLFGGIGGEDKADVGPEIREGLVGPGKAIEAALQDRGKIVATVICGDNYFAENSEQAIEEIMAMVVDFKPHILIAGPAFNAGRYGVACGAICKAAQKKLEIPAVTAMYEENPGVDLYKKEVYILRTKDSAMGMATAVPAMVNLVLKLDAKETIGRPDEEGYFARGILKTVTMEKNAAVRAVDKLLKKMKGEAFESELTPPKFERVAPAPPVKDLSKATIAIVTDGGLIPKGNPDKMAARAATVFGAYDIEGKDSLSGNEYQGHHLGYDNSSANQNPNRIVPLDVMRDLEREGKVGKIHNTYYTCAGVATDMANGKKIGRGIAEKLKSAGVDGVILTSTWGSSTRCGAAMTREIELAGIPTAQICTMTPVASLVGANRIIPGNGIVQPTGDASLEPAEERKVRRTIVETALESLHEEIEEQKLYPRSV